MRAVRFDPHAFDDDLITVLLSLRPPEYLQGSAMTTPVAQRILSHLTTAEYRKGERSIRLYGMFHVGDAHYLKTREEQIQYDHEEGREIHHEGFGDGRPKWVPARGYDDIARKVGWEAQKRPQYAQIHDASWDSLTPALKAQYVALSCIATMKVRVVAKVLGWAPTVAEARDLLMRALEQSRPERRLWRSLMSHRERVAIDAAVSAQAPVSLVWGQGHIAAFEKLLVERGYSKVAQEE